jgi:hypothetical protein
VIFSSSNDISSSSRWLYKPRLFKWPTASPGAPQG